MPAVTYSFGIAMYEALIPLLVVVGGMLIIFKSSEQTIENAILIAKSLGISELAVGFILLSVATSLPEFVISATAAFRGGTDLAVGNIFGANISDVSLVLGVAAILGVVTVKRKDLRELVMILLGTSVISLLFVIYQPRRLAGVILFLVFLAYSYWMLMKDRQAGGQIAGKVRPRLLWPLAKFSFFAALVLLSAQFVVENAVRLSAMLGVAQTVIGGTIISVGSTLPELSVSIAAVRKRQDKMAIGNAVGSSIVNLTLVFGTALMINPGISVASATKLMIFSVIANMVLLYFIVTKGKLERREGYLLVIGYLAFLTLFGIGNF